jgi:hypothetical protein
MLKKTGLIMLVSILSIIKANAQGDMGIQNEDSSFNNAGNVQSLTTDTTTGPEAPPQQPINDFVVPFLLIGTLMGGYFFYKINNKSTVSKQ